VGIYHIAAVSASGNDFGGMSGKNNLGLMARAGLDIEHFRVALTYHLAGKDKLKNKAGFLNITIGVYIGGGKVQKEPEK
jgi:hypothetical protein